MSQFIRIADKIINLDQVRVVRPSWVLNEEKDRTVDGLEFYMTDGNGLYVSKKEFSTYQEGVLSSDKGFEFYIMCCSLLKQTKNQDGTIVEGEE